MVSLLARFGIFYGWWIVFCAATIVFLSAGVFFYGFGLLVGPLTDEFGWSRASISGAFSLRTEVGGIAAPLVGIMVDRVGVRRLTCVGVVVVAIGFVGLSRVETLWGFYAATVFIAVGMSATGGATANVAITQWFRRKRGRAMGLMTLGGGVSGISAVFLAWIISTLGWRDALVAIGIGQLVLCLPLALTMRDKPEDVGTVVDGEPEETVLPVTGAGAVAVPPSRFTGNETTARQALRSPLFWKIALVFALGNFATTAIIVHQVPFLVEQVGTSDGIAALSVTLVTFISIGGRLTFGPAADKYPAVRLLALAMAMMTAGLIALATVREQWQLLYAVPIFGLGFGAVIPLRPVVQAEYFGLKAFGTIQGITLTVTTIFAVAGPVMAGALYDASGTYRLAFMLLALGPLIAIPLALSIGRPPQRATASVATA